jgi:hypothetical protein
VRAGEILRKVVREKTSSIIIKSRCISAIRYYLYYIFVALMILTRSVSSSLSLSHYLRSASMVSLESFAQRQSEDAKDAENEETKKGNIKRRKERRRSAGLHCQRCLKRTRKGVRVSFLTSPALVGFVSGAIAFGFSSASAFALRRGKGVLFGALANAQPTTSSKTKKKKK